MRDAGLHVIEASNAAEAIDVVSGGVKPDILFTDVRMPGHIDGLELAAFLENLVPGLTVIIASAHFKQEDLKLRVNFIPKPYDPQSVAKQIAHALKA